MVELSVVCPSCASEVSAYVTECPYCGARVRKRAPELERRGEELTAKETRREKRDRRRSEKHEARRGRPRGAGRRVPHVELGGRTWAVWPAILIPAVLLVLIRGGLFLDEAAEASTVGLGSGQWWHDLVASFIYFDVGYLFVIGMALALLLPALERRIGLPAAVLLVLALGEVSMLAAEGWAGLFDEVSFASGGNGVALGILGAWYVMRRAEIDAGGNDEGFDVALAGVGAAVLLLLPVVDNHADLGAGLAGGLAGLLAGLVAARVRARAA